MFQLIHGIEREQPDYEGIHLRAMLNAYVRYLESQDRSDPLKAVNHGIRWAVLLEKKNYEPEDLFRLFEGIQAILTHVTPRELMQVFPITKTYDGEKWECKDYFYTMDALREHGLDKPLGEEVTSILWDYTNRFTCRFLVGYLGVVSDLYRAETGKGAAETFFEENGVKVYRSRTDPVTGKRYLYDGTSGKTFQVKRHIPRYLKVRKG